MVLNVLPFVHDLLDKTITKNDITIDATVGNGHDTLKLCTLSKFVYGFDVQNQAIENTNALLSSNNVSNFKLIHGSHEHLEKYIKEPVKAITFNLGYLPGSNKDIVTTSTTTIQAIQSGLHILKKGGIVTIILYIGHYGGLQESNEVESYTKSLDKRKYKVAKYDFINREKSPYVIVIEKQ